MTFGAASGRLRPVGHRRWSTDHLGGTGPRRLGIYVDAVYRRTREHGSTDRAFLLFAAEVGARFDGLVLFGRTLDTPETADYELHEATQFVELPYYTSLLHLGEVARALPGTFRAMWRGLDLVDPSRSSGPTRTTCS